MSEIKFRPIEDTSDGNLLDSIARTYVAKNIGELFRISLLEFLDLPRDIVELLINIADDEMKSKKIITDKLQSDLKGLR